MRGVAALTQPRDPLLSRWRWSSSADEARAGLGIERDVVRVARSQHRHISARLGQQRPVITHPALLPLGFPLLLDLGRARVLNGQLRTYRTGGTYPYRGVGWTRLTISLLSGLFRHSERKTLIMLAELSCGEDHDDVLITARPGHEPAAVLAFDEPGSVERGEVA